MMFESEPENIELGLFEIHSQNTFACCKNYV